MTNFSAFRRAEQFIAQCNCRDLLKPLSELTFHLNEISRTFSNQLQFLIKFQILLEHSSINGFVVDVDTMKMVNHLNDGFDTIIGYLDLPV